MTDRDKALTAIRQTKTNINQLCGTVNDLHRNNGGTTLKVRAVDFHEQLDFLQKYIESMGL